MLDPAEETLPYEGRTEFVGLKAASAGSPTGWRRCATLSARVCRPTAPDSRPAATLGWSFLVHHTDRPAAEPLLALIMRLQGVAGDYA